MKNVLFIVYYFPPMGGSGVQRPLKFIKYLREFGWNPIVLCPEPGIYSVFDESLEQELKSIDPEIYRVQPKTPFHISENAGKPKRMEFPETLTKISRRISRLFMYPDNKKGWIKPAVEKGIEIINSKNIDLIFSTAPPFSNHIIGSTLSKKNNIPLILDYRDAWQQNHFFSEIFSWQKKIMYNMEVECLKQADAVTGLDAFMLSEMEDSFPGLIKQSVVIPHGFDPDDFMYPEKANLSYKKNKLNILYSGLFYELNQPDVFLKGIKVGLEKSCFSKEEIHLHFQGGLSRRILNLINQLNLADIVTDYGYLDHDIAVANLLKADLLWMISNFSAEYKQIKSGKLFEYLGARKPILGLVNAGEEAELLKKYVAGYIANVDSPVSIADSILEILKIKQDSNSVRPNDVFIDHFNRKKITGRLAQIFNDLALQFN